LKEREERERNEEDSREDVGASSQGNREESVVGEGDSDGGLDFGDDEDDERT